jgi:hypothetical protein
LALVVLAHQIHQVMCTEVAGQILYSVQLPLLAVVLVVVHKQQVFSQALLAVLVAVVQMLVLEAQVTLLHNLHLKETMVVHQLELELLALVVAVVLLL